MFLYKWLPRKISLNDNLLFPETFEFLLIPRSLLKEKRQTAEFGPRFNFTIFMLTPLSLIVNTSGEKMI